MTKNDKITIVIAILIFIGIVLASAYLRFGFDWNNDASHSTTASTASVTTENSQLNFVDVTTPEYRLIMPEKPNDSMWEFVSGVNKHECITVAYLEPYVNDKPVNTLGYMVNMFSQKSTLNDEAFYFIEIGENLYKDMGINSILIPVNQSSIDQIWNVIKTAIDAYNVNAQKCNNGEIEYDANTWVEMIETIEQFLAKAEIKTTERIHGVVIVNP